MFIDFHVHVYENDWHPWVMDFLKKSNPNFDFTKEMTRERLIKILDDANVRYAVILAENAPAATGIVRNEYVAEFCRDEERFIPFASINPNTSRNIVEEMEKAYEMGCRGLKLLPSYMYFYPNEARVYRLYEKCSDLRIPVMFHTGTSVFRNVRQKYADPIHLDDVAVDFPDLTIVMAHSGRGIWYDTAFMLARLHDNIYLEISGLPPKKLLEYFPRLEELENKVIFGSDFPSADIKRNIRDIRSLPISERAKKKILGLNAARILGLNV